LNNGGIKIFEDYNHIQTIIGLIRFALSKSYILIFQTLLDIEDNMILKSSEYQLTEQSQERMIKDREAISSLTLDSPNIIDHVGLDKNLLERPESQEKLQLDNKSPQGNSKLLK
jgi:hypothetical protein